VSAPHRTNRWPDPQGIAEQEMERGLAALREAALQQEIEDEIDSDLRRGVRASGSGSGDAETDVTDGTTTFAAEINGTTGLPKPWFGR
jgi:hypothetical protein